MIKLHIGCGKRNFGPDWIHIDKCENEYDHIINYDITNLPYKENEIDIIYASHVIEYFDQHEIFYVLKDWYSKLKQDGILRLAVPNFEIICKLYLSGKYGLEKFTGPLYGRMYSGNDLIYHKMVYDQKTLTKLLESCGFRNVRWWYHSEVEHGHIDDHSHAYLPHMDKENGTLISLNLECNK